MGILRLAHSPPSIWLYPWWRKKKLYGLLAKFPAKDQVHHRDCFIYPRGSLANVLYGVTTNINHLYPGQLIHVDFFFTNNPSIHRFKAVLNTIDAKTRKMWKLCTPNKRPPLLIVRFFLSQLYRMGHTVSHLRTDVDGALANCDEFCAMLKDEFQIVLERTGIYSSWLNGKVKCHNRTAWNVIQVGTIGHVLGYH